MNNEIVSNAMEMVKARIGISTSVRDMYLQEIIRSVVTQLEQEQGLSLKSGNSYHLMFIVDFSVWRYQNVDESGAIPRHLQFRMHNLVITGGGNDVQS
ncbi:hypothetical protein [Lentibacillus amyloliquefaciens]|uniref:DNA-packaging protein n=1 Tax=Lentibacillus amyloliquefaciens TaxID=1472767 RepID=A0A0U3WBR3_9BACI|nr:hypothetical protein [Lentibacillus amyloliquefaciens]ALX50464.1 hypothetical protein AOX59_18885 [Lentibacillus amyloliquefaciens]